MASASGLFTPSVPSLRRRVQPSTWIYRSGFCFSQGTFRRVLCSSTIAGSEKSLSSSESRAPRDVEVSYGFLDVIFQVSALRFNSAQFRFWLGKQYRETVSGFGAAYFCDLEDYV
ncbi:hypothetical protein WN944_013625 [Citrus x changshan-huyou]|uniref:Uncharacterized protein n=1 Tax=Citrus x changshan-huyou TaxID=2935761 RepID=A0AAP0QJZ9_9ROSI